MESSRGVDVDGIVQNGEDFLENMAGLLLVMIALDNKSYSRVELLLCSLRTAREGLFIGTFSKVLSLKGKS